MTVMYSFCLWFPIRLGAIIVGISTADMVSRLVTMVSLGGFILFCVAVFKFQSLVCLIACIVGNSDGEGTSIEIERWLKSTDFLLANDLFVTMRDDPHTVLGGFIAAFTIHLISCALLILGVYRCTLSLIYPFVGIDFLRLIVVSVAFILIILIIKVNTNTLGYVISCSIGGGFALLYLWYQWFCVVSLCQILRQVERMDKSSKRFYPPRYEKSTVPYKNDIQKFPTADSDISLYNKKSAFYGLPNVTF